MAVVHGSGGSTETRRRVLSLLAACAVSAGCAKDVEFVRVEALMARWNEAADGVQDPSWDFHWAASDRFPHPTYEGGSAEAYRKFAEVLVRFFEQGDNFDYLATHRLFTYPLRNGSASVFTFQQLTDMLLLDWIGLSSEMLAKLQSFAMRIRATV